MVEATEVVSIVTTEGMIIGKVTKDTTVTMAIVMRKETMTVEIAGAEIREEAGMKAEGMTVAEMADMEEVEINHLIIK